MGEVVALENTVLEAKRSGFLLGVYPDVNLKAARDKRDDARKQLGVGIDPGEARRAEKIAQAGAESFEAIAREWHSKFSAGWVASHGDRIHDVLLTHFHPLARDAPFGVFPDLSQTIASCAIRPAARIRRVC